MRISDWSSDVCSSDLAAIDYALPPRCPACGTIVGADRQFCLACWSSLDFLDGPACARCSIPLPTAIPDSDLQCGACLADPPPFEGEPAAVAYGPAARTVALRLKYGRRLGHARLMAALMLRPLRALAGEGARSDEHTSELQSLLRISYAVF